MSGAQAPEGGEAYAQTMSRLSQQVNEASVGQTFEESEDHIALLVASWAITGGLPRGEDGDFAITFARKLARALPVFRKSLRAAGSRE